MSVVVLLIEIYVEVGDVEHVITFHGRFKHYIMLALELYWVLS
jgi:hypothetical protein